jgi:hypothetical protein
MIGIAVGLTDRTLIQEGAKAESKANDATELKDGAFTTTETATAAAAPQGAPNVIAKFDGSGLPNANSIMSDDGAKVTINNGRGPTNPLPALDIASGRLSLSSPFGDIQFTETVDLFAHVTSDNQTRGFATLPAFRVATGTGLTVLATMLNNGNMGIGTQNPTSKLEIAAQDGLAISGYQPFLTLRDANAANARSVIQGVNGDIVFVPQRFIGSGRAAMVVKTGSGNVEISGQTTTRVLQITGGSDVAEPFKISGGETIEPGMVVAIDPQHAGHLRLADRAYDRTVAGIVSGANGINPGLTMKQEGTTADGSLPLALSGRVYCRADASYGPIRPGDLLTSSDTPGHAMRVIHHKKAQGAIIGKAMTALAEGKGFVLVLVTLQ